MPDPLYSKLPPTKNSEWWDDQDQETLARTALGSGIAGLGIGGLVSLAYMVAEALKDKPRAKDKQTEVEGLSPYLPTTGVPTKHMSKGANVLEDAGRGLYMVPLMGLSATLPAWLTYKFLKDRYTDSRTGQLERELESVREEFREALAGDTKLSADIDGVIDTFNKTTTKKEAQQVSPPGPSTNIGPLPKGTDSPGKSVYESLGGAVGLATGGLSLAGLVAAYLTYKLIDSRSAKSNPKTQAIRAMKEMQQRRKALSEISPHINIEQSPEGNLYPSI
jgi:hypothetical protein